MHIVLSGGKQPLRGESMATWTVRTGEGVVRGLTRYQVDLLVWRGRLAANDEARADDAPENAVWHRVEDVPRLERERRESAAQVQPKQVDEALLASMLSLLGDDASPRRMRRAVAVLWMVAGLLLTAELYVFASVALGW